MLVEGAALGYPRGQDEGTVEPGGGTWGHARKSRSITLKEALGHPPHRYPLSLNPCPRKGKGETQRPLSRR